MESLSSYPKMFAPKEQRTYILKKLSQFALLSPTPSPFPSLTSPALSQSQLLETKQGSPHPPSSSR